jgi:uncharacterized membrane protein
MNLRLKPRGFADYGIFALLMTGLLVFLFWVEASNGIGWADAVLAFAAAVLLVFAIILVRRNEKASWIARPSWPVRLLFSLGAFALIFGAIYADAYIFHRDYLTANRLSHDVAFCIAMSVGVTWSLRRQNNARRQLS